MNSKGITRTYKDRLFVFIFGSRKEWTLSLYNALNGTHYDDPEAIEYNTLSDVIYMSMKNDVSFLMIDILNMWEQQSTFNPNLPLRFLVYLSKLYEQYVSDTYGWESVYGSHRLVLPTPKMVVFYNGEKNQPSQSTLRLSDAFSARIEPDIDITVRMININYNENQELFRLCKPLHDYSWLVSRIRTNVSSGMVLSDVVTDAIHSMPDGEIRKFLLAHESEVKDMMLTEYDEKAVLDVIGRQSYEDGVEKGRTEGKAEGKAEVQEKDDNDIISAIHGVMTAIGVSADKAMEMMHISDDRKNRYKGRV